MANVQNTANTREFHTLNEAELEIVNNYVEMFECSEEEGLKFALEAGEISESESSGGGSFIPEGFKELKFHSGHPKSKFTKVDKMSKKAKVDTPFETENWYYGAEFPTDDDKNLLLDKVQKGEELGMCPEMIVTHIQYSGQRFIPDAQDNISTILAPNMFNDSQKQMIDTKSKRSLYELRTELFAEYGGKENVPNERKIKFEASIFGLVKTESGWKPFVLKASIGKPEYNTVAKYLEDSKGKVGNTLLCRLNTEEDSSSDGNYFKIIEVIEPLDPDTKKETRPFVMSNMKAVSKFLAEQKESVKPKEDSTPEIEDEEDPFSN